MRGQINIPYYGPKAESLAVRILTWCVGVTGVMFAGALFAYSMAGGAS